MSNRIYLFALKTAGMVVTGLLAFGLLLWGLFSCLASSLALIAAVLAKPQEKSTVIIDLKAGRDWFEHAKG